MLGTPCRGWVGQLPVRATMWLAVPQAVAVPERLGEVGQREVRRLLQHRLVGLGLAAPVEPGETE